MDLTTVSAQYKMVAIGIFAVFMLPMAYKMSMHKFIGIYILVLPFTTYFSGNPLLNVIFVAFLAMVFVVNHFKDQGNTFKIDAIAVCGILFVISFIPSMMFSPPSLILDHIFAWSKFLANIVFYVIFVNSISDEKKREFIINILIVTLIAYALVSFVELIWFPYQGSQGWRIRGPFHEYELFSEYLAIMCPLVIYKFAIKKRVILAISISGVIVILMILTGTRGGPIALAVGFVVWWALEHGQRLKRMAYFLVLLVVLIPIGYGGYSLLLKHTRMGESKDTIVDRFAETKFEGLLPDTRANVWDIHWERVKEIWMIGDGPCHGAQWFYVEAHKTHKNLLEGSRRPKGSKIALISFPHNLYLTLLELGGILCLLSFLGIISICYYKLFKLRSKLIRSREFSSEVGFINVLLVMLTIFVVDEIKIEFIRYHHYMLIIFSSIFCLIGSTLQIYKKKMENV